MVEIWQIIACIRLLWPTMENEEGREGKKSILFENSWENLEKYKEKNRVNDTKGFRLQNPLDSKCFERRNLGIEWGESGDNNK